MTKTFQIVIDKRGEVTNRDMLKAVFPDVNFDYKIWWDDLYFKDTDWFYEPYEQKESKDD